MLILLPRRNVFHQNNMPSSLWQRI